MNLQKIILLATIAGCLSSCAPIARTISAPVRMAAPLAGTVLKLAASKVLTGGIL